MSFNYFEREQNESKNFFLERNELQFFWNVERNELKFLERNAGTIFLVEKKRNESKAIEWKKERNNFNFCVWVERYEYTEFVRIKERYELF